MSFQRGDLSVDRVYATRLDRTCWAILDPSQSNEAKSDYSSPNGKSGKAVPQDRYQTVQEVADKLEVAESTVRQWIKAGALRAIDIGKGWSMKNQLRATAPDLGSVKAAGAAHPIGTMGEPEDIARAVVWLAPDEATLASGTEILIDSVYAAR